MVKFKRCTFIFVISIVVICIFTGCSNKPDSGNKISVENIHKGNGKYDKTTYYISALNVDTASNNSFMKQDIINVGVDLIEDRVINPYFIKYKSDMYLIQSLWEPLMKKGYDGEYYPNILKTLPTVSEDKTTYFFTLREDLTWEDGSKITTKDIEFTYKFLMDKSYDGNYDREDLGLKNWLDYKNNVKEQLDGFEILDDYNFRVIVDKSNINTMDLLNIYPLSYLYYGSYYTKGSISDDLNIKPFGNGVFKFLGIEKNKYIILESNSNYYKGKSNIKTLTYKKVDSRKLINELVSGNIDISRDVFLNKLNIEETAKSQFLNGYIFPHWEYLYIGINHNKPVLKDLNIRKAINLSINRKNIVDKLSNGNLSVLNIPLDRHFYDLYDPDVDSKDDFNKREATNLLEKSGWKKGVNGIREKDKQKLEFTFLTKKNDYLLSNIVQIIEKDLLDVGIGLVVQEVDEDLIKSKIKEDSERIFDLFLMSPNFDFNSDWFKSFTTLGKNNWYGYSNNNLDQVLSQLHYEFDVDKSKELYENAKKIIREDIPVIPIFRNKQFDIYNGRISGINSANVYKTFYYDEIILKK